MSWRACAASSSPPSTPTPPRRYWSPRWCRTTIRCLPTVLAGRSSFASAAARYPTWSRTSTAWPAPTCAGARSRTARSSRSSILPRLLTRFRCACSTLLRRRLPIFATSRVRARRPTTLRAAALSPSASCRCPSMTSYTCWTCCAAGPFPLSPPGHGGRRRTVPTRWRLNCLRKGRTRRCLSAHRSSPPKSRRRLVAATICACRPMHIALPRAMLPIWSTRTARAVPTRRLLSMLHRFCRVCCPAARRSISPPNRWASSAAWRCPCCANTPTSPLLPCLTPWRPSRALLWQSVSTTDL